MQNEKLSGWKKYLQYAEELVSNLTSTTQKFSIYNKLMLSHRHVISDHVNMVERCTRVDKHRMGAWIYQQIYKMKNSFARCCKMLQDAVDMFSLRF